MRVFGRLLVLAGLTCALVPATASAAPLLVTGSGGSDCAGIVGSTTTSCGLFSLGSLLGSNTLDITFESDKDVALFEFTVDTDSTFLAHTSSSVTGLDSILGLFDASTGTLHSYINPADGAEYQAFGADIDPFGNFNDQLGSFVLAGGTSYYLAVLLNPIDLLTSNGFNGTPTSLLEGFGCDGDGLCLGGGGMFSLSLETTPIDDGTGGPQPVPEPGTLALLGSGALAALARSRAKKRA